MTGKILSCFGTSGTTVAAVWATVSYDDLRVWAVSLVSLSITLIGFAHNRRKARADACAAESIAEANAAHARRERYEAQRERMRLCDECFAMATRPATCVVSPKFRPPKCPLRK